MSLGNLVVIGMIWMSLGVWMCLGCLDRCSDVSGCPVDWVRWGGEGRTESGHLSDREDICRTRLGSAECELGLGYQALLFS